MKSMTGYAKVQSSFGDKKLNIEIKTLNSKQLDLIVKVPAAYRSHELDIRAMLGVLERGKVECILSEENSTSSDASFNTDLLVSRYNALVDVANDLHAVDLMHRASLFTTVAAMSDIWNTATSDEVSDEQWQQTAADLQRAIDLCDQFRAHEGSVLEVDFHKHVDLIEDKLRQIPALEGERIDTAKERIKRYLADANVEVDPNRFEQELIYYLEKLDITEEKVRLQKHIDYFRQTMATEPSCGKKLGFVAQEMGREINTTGSKANHAGIQKIVVEMKDELEKIKEQLGNVL
ncbi:MAG: YicC family protein [Bacteroidales bacterium]|nr:YicC family protein [Bacteroidales bacterium]